MNCACVPGRIFSRIDMELLVTRPEPDASRQALALEAIGMGVVVEPLMRIEFNDCEPLDLDGVQALIATSRNGLRALERLPELERARALPLIAVGPASAEKARALGFGAVYEGSGTADGLVEIVQAHAAPERGAVLHLAGASLASDLKGALEALGFQVRQPVLYRATGSSQLSEPVGAAMRAGDIGGVVLMSPRTAKIYRVLIEEAGLMQAASNVIHFCLSPAVAARLEGAGFDDVRICARPREDDLLALIARETAD